MTASIALLAGFGLGVLAAVLAAAAWSRWAEFAVAHEEVEPEPVHGDVPFLGHALAIWSGLHGSSGRNDAAVSPQPERTVTHG